LARRGGKYKGKRRSGREQRTTAAGSKRYYMLNRANIDVFRYEMRDILEGSAMDEGYRESFIATVMGKGLQISSDEAKAFVDEVLERGDIDEESAKRVHRTIERHTKRR
jgi:hypothetical protein